MDQADIAKKAFCSTLPLRMNVRFYAICYKKYGRGKYSLQKGLTETINHFISEFYKDLTEEERIAFDIEIKKDVDVEWKKLPYKEQFIADKKLKEIQANQKVV